MVIVGHSQGGQAALWAGSLAKKWTPDLTVRGTLAFAPVSHVGEQGGLLRALTTPSSLSALAAMIVRGVDIGNPSLNVAGLLSEQATALYPQIGERCLDGLREQDSFGAVAPADLFRPDAQLDPVIAALNASDAETLKIPGPVLIEQGTADTTVFPNFTDQLYGELKGNGVNLTYKTYARVDHGTVVTKKAPADHATTWIEKRF